MPAKRTAATKEAVSTATIGFEAVAKCEVRSASAEVKKSPLFVIRNSRFGICPVPSCVVRCLVEMLAPYKGRIYDPACGSGAMLLQSEKFVEYHATETLAIAA